MSIEKFEGIYTPTCDICGYELHGEFEFSDAVDAKKREKWRSIKLQDGTWQDICPNCFNK